jgi:hypothetical protein
VSESKQIRIIDLLRDIDAATARMSKTNPHKIVLMQAGAAIIELAQRAAGLEPQHIAIQEAAEGVI